MVVVSAWAFGLAVVLGLCAWAWICQEAADAIAAWVDRRRV